MTTTTKATLLKIASDKLGLTTLDAEGRDRADFHDLHVTAIADALEAAFEAGKAQAKFRHVAPR